jgi:polyisoprenoid-binding protein YceI
LSSVIENDCPNICTLKQQLFFMATNWNLDTSHSEVTFKIKHMMIANVSGQIGKFNVTASSDDDQFNNAQIEFTADMSTITTGDAQRDGHLQAPDFFDVQNFPEMKFKSTSYSGGKLKGNLTIKDVTHEVELDVEAGGSGKDPWGNHKIGFTVSGKISRKDWNLVWNATLETGGVLVSDEVKILCEIQMAKAN